MRLFLEPGAGEEITEVAEHLCRLAALLGIVVRCDFNGIGIWAVPGDNFPVVAARYWTAMRRDREQHDAVSTTRGGGGRVE